MEKQQPVKIDIEEIIAAKNPKLLKRMPGFLLRYIKRILHVDDNNHILEKYADLRDVDFARAVVSEWKFDVQVRNEDRLMGLGRCIFVANHPLGGIESLEFISLIAKYYPELRFPVNDLLLYLKNLNGIFLPINKHGHQGRDAAINMDQAYASNAQILFFPAGLVSRRIKGKIMDTEWKKNFISKAIQYNRDVVPIHISGRNSNFFYNLSGFRKRMGIKANIEMFYLINEMYKNRNGKLVISVGEKISPIVFDNSRTKEEWAEFVKSETYKLAGEE